MPAFASPRSSPRPSRSRWPSTGVALIAPAHSDIAANEQCRPDGLYRTPGVDVPYCLAYDNAGPREDGRRPPPPHHRILHVVAARQGRTAGLPGQQHPVEPGHPHQLRLRPRRRAEPHLRRHADGGEQRGHQHDLARDGRRRDGPGVLVHRATSTCSTSSRRPTRTSRRSSRSAAGPRPAATSTTAGTRADCRRLLPDDDDGRPTASTRPASTRSPTRWSRSCASTASTGSTSTTSTRPRTTKAGNPLDFAQADAKRAGLNASYQVLMRTLREKLDAASAADGRYYMLTVAAPSSGWLLRGMESYQSLQYLDYVNIMTYDLHGAWNQYVGPNAALYDNGDDNELTAGGVYDAYGIGYLNTDWSYHYFRGAMTVGPHQRRRARTTPAASRTSPAARTACGGPPRRRPTVHPGRSRRAATARSGSTTSGTTCWPTGRRSRPGPTRCGTRRTCRTAGPGRT